MSFKEFFSQFNVIGQCRKYGVNPWQCPQFLFLIMGFVIICSTLIVYAVGNRFIESPQMVALAVILTAAILFIITVIITRSFERLADANRLKTEFVSIVSHQLRSPLSNLKWATELLMSGRVSKVTEKQLEYFKILKENNSRMEELVSDLLIVSKIEQGKLPLKKKEIVLKGLVEEAIEGVKIFAKASNVKIEFKAEGGQPKVIVDPSQIKLVVENLLDNAIRYIEKEGRVKIKLEKKDKALYFEIQDNGAGIPKNDQKHIFQKFFRSGNALRNQTEGSGLGLYIAKFVVEKSGGKINFKSREGKGSTFWFTIPLR
ncbi:MAG: HAMP domain-containing sensor histidine kinase [bacterium]